MIPNTRILCSAFWGVSRHVNYLGETLQALALALPGFLVTGGVSCWVPFLYPLYYMVLFTTRQIDDDKVRLLKTIRSVLYNLHYCKYLRSVFPLFLIQVCRAKYGKSWDIYVQRVPYRIIPGLW